MSYGGTPWGYINERKRAEEAEGEKYQLEKKNKQLKKLVQWLMKKAKLTEEEKSTVRQHLKDT